MFDKRQVSRAACGKWNIQDDQYWLQIDRKHDRTIMLVHMQMSSKQRKKHNHSLHWSFFIDKFPLKVSSVSLF
jgi:hypothetical protein